MKSSPRFLRWIVLSLIPLAIGCSTLMRGGDQSHISRERALSLAVHLANEKCQEQFSHAPFDNESYDIEYKEGRWHWGQLDPMGCGGFAAIVSFNGDGEDHSVEVCFSTDAATPVEEPGQNEDRR